MTREERMEIVEHAAEAGAFDAVWNRDWRGSFDHEREDRCIATILIQATVLVDEAPADVEEAAFWAWKAIAWAAIRYGNDPGTLRGNEVPTFIKRKVERALAAIAAGAPVVEVDG